MRDTFDAAVGREGAFLILAAEKLELDLLALVLVRVVLDGSEGSGFRSTIGFAPAVDAAGCRSRVVPVWSQVGSKSGSKTAARVLPPMASEDIEGRILTYLARRAARQEHLEQALGLISAELSGYLDEMEAKGWLTTGIAAWYGDPGSAITHRFPSARWSRRSPTS